MVFSSAVFLFIFLPVLLLAHTVIRNTTARNALLIAASLIFYAFGEPVYILLLLASVAVNYLFGCILGRHRHRGVLAVAVILNLILLVVYKYTGFIVETVNLIPGINIPVPDITMPIGISFFTFQAISYIVDVYREKTSKKAGFFDVLLYISLFPQLIAGPIVQYRTVADSIKNRTVTADRLSTGIRRFIIGLSKKMLLANTMGYAADKIFALDTGNIDTPLAWLGAVCYTLQIYFDFSGYSDMAVGIGHTLGFDFPENFNYPYAAVGIRDFWRRWHMSLTGWFREYLYIPLGGNRKGKARQILNNMIVFICTGIWHGANLTFIVWGAFHGALLSIETIFSRKNRKTVKGLIPLKWIYTIFCVIIGFVIFRADTLKYGFEYIGRMFSFTVTDEGIRILLSHMTPSFICTMVAAVIACVPWVPIVRSKISKGKSYRVVSAVCYAVSMVLLFLCVLTLAGDSYNPFIYFRF